MKISLPLLEERKHFLWQRFTISLSVCVLFSLLLLSHKANASLPEFFGSSSTSLGLGGQFTGRDNSPENNYYAPALLAFGKGTSYSLSSFVINTEFENISNVVITNSVSGSPGASDEYGTVDTDYELTTMGAMHLSMPLLGKKLKTRLAVSIYAPLDRLIEASSGDYFKPEYVLYKSRYKRTLFSVNLSQPFYKNGKKDWSFSVGVHTGIQTEGETYIVARGNGDSGSSNGKLKFQASPSAAVILGYTKYWKDFIFYATFQDEVKNEFDTTASGYTPLGGSATIPFDLKLTALLYYDPRILRLGSFYKSNNSFNFITTIEYQDWSGFEAPKTHIITSSGFNSSTDYESLETKGIIVPKVAAQYIYSEKLKINAGLYYRPSPIESNLGAGGNSLDPEVYAASVGLTYKQKILGELINFSSAFQFQYLKNQDVSKSDLDEAGASGKKIGAPGYSVGGSVQVVSFGVDWQV